MRGHAFAFAFVFVFAFDWSEHAGSLGILSRTRSELHEGPAGYRHQLRGVREGAGEALFLCPKERGQRTQTGNGWGRITSLKEERKCGRRAASGVYLVSSLRWCGRRRVCAFEVERKKISGSFFTDVMRPAERYCGRRCQLCLLPLLSLSLLRIFLA